MTPSSIEAGDTLQRVTYYVPDIVIGRKAVTACVGARFLTRIFNPLAVT